MVEIKWRKVGLTVEQLEHLVLDYNQDMPIKDIMAKYDLSRASIYNYLKKYSEK